MPDDATMATVSDDKLMQVGLSGQVTVTSWLPEDGLDFPEWEHQLGLAGRLGETTRFWLGDGLCYGETTFGEKHAQAIVATGLDAKTLTKTMWVCRRVAPEVRREDLSFGHHEAVAHLDDQGEQAKWLEKAAKNHWTRDELRAMVKGRKPAAEDPQERAAVSAKRQQAMKEGVERALAKWWDSLKPKEIEKIRTAKAYRVSEFGRAANLAVRACVKVLEGSGD